MREFQIMVDPLGAVTVSGSSRLLGYGGEHNVARLNVNFDDFEQSVFKDAGYYRLALGDYYSDALYLENGELSYLVPFDAVIPPMICCQIIGYTDKEGEPVKIAKSSVFTMEVKFSKVPRAAISNSTDVFERTLAKCEVALKSSLEASNEARLYAESAALNMERSEESSVIAVQSADSARVAAKEAEEAIGTLENFATLHNNVANAIKRTVKSNAVAAYDVSPIEHDVQVKLTSDTVTDFSKVKLFKYGKNLFDYTLPYTVGRVLDKNTGELINWGSSWCVYDYIEIQPNITCTTSAILNQNRFPICFYDKDKMFISSAEDEFISENNYHPIVFTTPPNCKYMRISAIIAAAPTSMIVLGEYTKEQMSLMKYELYVEPTEYSVNAEGCVSDETKVIYTESDGNAFVTSSSDENCLVLDTSKISSDATKLHLVAEFETVAGASGHSRVEFEFTKGVVPSDGIYGVQYDVAAPSEIYEITNVTTSAENGFPEKITVTWGVTNLVSYTAEITSGDGEANVKSIYPSMSLLTDTDGVLIDVEYNRDINKAFAELQEAIINLGGTLNV